jgi:hypothetical protein
MQREGHLLFPGTPRNPEETLAVHLALSLGESNREESGAEGPENVAGVSGELVHAHEGISTLRHGSLPEHLTGAKKVEPFGRHDLSRRPNHEGMTVDAGVHLPTVAISRMSKHLEVGGADIHNSKGNPQQGGGLPG